MPASDDSKKTILITSGRAPVALELARMFHRAGHRVIVAETLKRHLSSHSRCVSKNVRVSWPTKDPEKYQSEIAAIIEQEAVDLLLPTCEEICYLSANNPSLKDPRYRWVPDWKQLHALHSKWEFVQLARRLNLAVPKTRLVSNREELEQAYAEGAWGVFKPVYSRFASRALINPASLDELAEVTPTATAPWVAQQFLAGEQLSTFSLAWEGKLLAHVTYPMNFTTGIGPAYGYESVNQPAVRQWVAEFVAAENFSGQIAFDFIVQEAGAVAAIECNPRATSGLHLFRSRTDLVDAYLWPAETHQRLEGAGECLQPNSRPAHHALPLLLWSLGYVRSWTRLKQFVRMLFRGRDVLLSWQDPWPILMVGFSLYPFFKRARQHSVSFDQATTMDIEWNEVPRPEEAAVAGSP